jgi:hypothetical protein
MPQVVLDCLRRAVARLFTEATLHPFHATPSSYELLPSELQSTFSEPRDTMKRGLRRSRALVLFLALLSLGVSASLVFRSSESVGE